MSQKRVRALWVTLMVTLLLLSGPKLGRADEDFCDTAKYIVGQFMIADVGLGLLGQISVREGTGTVKVGTVLGALQGAARAYEMIYGSLKGTQGIALARSHGVKIERSATWESVLVNAYRLQKLLSGVAPAVILLESMPHQKGSQWTKEKAFIQWDLNYLIALLGIDPKRLDLFFSADGIKKLEMAIQTRTYEDIAEEFVRQIFLQLPKEYEKSGISPPKIYYSTVYALTSGEFDGLIEDLRELERNQESVLDFLIAYTNVARTVISQACPDLKKSLIPVAAELNEKLRVYREFILDPDGFTRKYQK